MINKNGLNKFTITFLMATIIVLVVFPFSTNAVKRISFIDVNDQTVAPGTQNSIYELVELYAIKGYPDGTFKPYHPITRAQVAKIFTGAFGLSLPENLDWALERYKDVGPNHEYAVYIAATTVTGVFQGKEDGKFDPWSNITREQIAIAIGKVLEDYNTPENVDVNLNNISDEANKYVQIIANLGITNALDDYRPNEQVTRAQFADLAYRTLTVIDDNS